MAKKKNSRKALAVVLGVVGIAGLSLASASQLGVNVNDDNIAVGTGTFDAACDTSVDVDYTYDVANGTYLALTISDIAAECETLDLQYTLTTSDVDPAATVDVTGTTVVVDISSIPLTATLNEIDIAIY